MPKYKISYIADGEYYELTFDADTDQKAMDRFEAEKRRVGEKTSDTAFFELYRKIA